MALPIPLIVLGAVLLFLILILLLRVQLIIRAKDSVVLELKILFLRFRLFPRKKKINPKDYDPRRIERAKRKAAKKAAKQLKKKQKREAQHEASPPEKMPLADKVRLVRALAGALIRRTRKHLKLHAARLHIRVATGDAATTAITYGAVSQGLSYLLTALDQVTKLKATPPDVAVEADFIGERSEIDAKIIFSIRIFGALATAIPLLFTFLNTKRALKAARRKKQNSSERKETEHG